MHIERLLKNYTLGVQLKFEKELITWQQLQIQADPITILPEKDQKSKTLPVESIIKVFNVVKDSPNWKLVLDYFNIYKKMNDSIRCKLVDMIIHYIISSKMPMTIKLADSIADQIVCMFSSEVKMDIDFNELFTTKSNIIVEFEKYSGDLLKIIDLNIKDHDGKLLIESIKQESDNISQNGQNTVLFHLLSSLFVPTTRKVTRDENGKKNITKYSIKDSQNSFITFHNTIAASESHINNLKDKNVPIQPFIVVIGVPLKPEQIYLFFDSIKCPFAAGEQISAYKTAGINEKKQKKIITVIISYGI
ncbi:hypothetical protein ACI65C_004477 [Semiaphis heraclei]